ncbi:hypothetical protein BDV38DRAFT_278629 [Aspergillus pseudotamarii]|uniref:Uncharacterized protein n=1 Tax=Aspergillus pseudotamarii TaxID=132259 RepID=A0A5N6T6F5_ASPPS|nr:uncharacterized protein BDV38DRAFT_278629 [Aspergillus pseudotamarii]KAE8141847.1 hypothetical protein BDV38DRAFT_278629 [Aspergillus pseudotamarii]
MADNPVSPPAHQVAGGGSRPLGKRGDRGRRNVPARERGRKKNCRTCGETDHETAEHFEWAMMNAINALTGARKERLQAKRTVSSASNSQVAPAAQGGRQRRENKRGQRPPPGERKRRRAAEQQQQREIEHLPALTLQERGQEQPYPQHQQQREVEQRPVLTSQEPAQEAGFPVPMIQEPHPHTHHQGHEGPQVLPRRVNEPPLSPPMEDEPSDAKDLLRTVRTATFHGNTSLAKFLATKGACVSGQGLRQGARTSTWCWSLLAIWQSQDELKLCNITVWFLFGEEKYLDRIL